MTYIYSICPFVGARGSSVSIVIRLHTGRLSSISGKEGGGVISLHHRVQTGSGVHPAFYPMGTWALPPGVKLTTHLQLLPRLRMCGAIPPTPNTSSWRSISLRIGTTLPLPLYAYLTVIPMMQLCYESRDFDEIWSTKTTNLQPLVFSVLNSM